MIILQWPPFLDHHVRWVSDVRDASGCACVRACAPPVLIQLRLTDGGASSSGRVLTSPGCGCDRQNSAERDQTAVRLLVLGLVERGPRLTVSGCPVCAFDAIFYFVCRTGRSARI